MTDFLELADLSDQALRERYAAPSLPWLRLMFVVTADGAAQGPDALSRSISNQADQRVFQTLRALADVIVVGAGTAAAERYEPNPKPMVVVSRSGRVPDSLQTGDLSRLHLATGSHAVHLDAARELLGDRVLELGDEEPDLARLKDVLVDRGFQEILCEGGPSLAADLWARGLVDELSATVVPRVVAGGRKRMAQGADADVALRLASVVAGEDGTLLLRYLRS